MDRRSVTDLGAKEMASAFMAAARLRLAGGGGSDGVDDDLGTFERIPDKEDRAIDSEMNVRYNMRG